MAIRRFAVTATTAADGSVTAYSPYLSGYIHDIEYVKTDYADTVDFTITGEATGRTIWTEANVTASAVKAVRQPTYSNAGVAALYAAGGVAVNDRIALSGDRVKIALANGGNAKVGVFHITVDDGK